MEEDLPPHSLKNVTLHKIGQILAIALNLRVSLNTEVPAIPTDKLPILQGNASLSVLYVDFVDSIEDFNRSTEDICLFWNPCYNGWSGRIFCSKKRNRVQHSFDMLFSVLDGNFCQRD